MLPASTRVTDAVKLFSRCRRDDLACELFVSRRGYIPRDFDGERHWVVDRRRSIEIDPELAGDPRGDPQERRLDRQREDVHALDDEHVVGPTEDAEPEAGPARMGRVR